MKRSGPRILLMGGTYRALCVLERLLERDERVVAFIGEESGNERDFCPEILEACDRAAIPARSGRKLGEEIVRWLEDRIRPDLAISVGLRNEIPVSIGGNCRLGLVEVLDRTDDTHKTTITLRQSGHEILRREIPAPREESLAGDLYLEMAEHTIQLLDTFLDQTANLVSRPHVAVCYDPPASRPADLAGIAARPEPGPATAALEHEAAQYLEAQTTVALGDATAAFATLLETMGIGEGHEVIVPGLASRRAVAGVRAAGARVVLGDVDPGNLTLDLERAYEAISPATRAMIVSHAFGQPAELAELYALAADSGLPVIEDGAGALGGRFGGDRLGKTPANAVFQLPFASPGANATLVTVAPDLAERFRAAASGLRLGDGAAELARARLRDFDKELSARRHNASVYSSELVRYDAFRVPWVPEGRIPTYSAYVLRLTGFARTSAEDLVKLLGENGIEARRIAPIASERDLQDVPVAERARATAVLLPVASHIDDEKCAVVLESIFDYAIG